MTSINKLVLASLLTLICFSTDIFATTAIMGGVDICGRKTAVPGPDYDPCDHDYDSEVCISTVIYDWDATTYIAAYDPNRQLAYDDITGVSVFNFNPSTNTSLISVNMKSSTLTLVCTSKAALISYILAK